MSVWNRSWRTAFPLNGRRSPSASRDIMNFLAEQYLGRLPRQTPLASPVFADLHGIAPLAIFVGSTDRCWMMPSQLREAMS